MSIVTYNNRSIADITAVPGAARTLTHIKTLTASSSATLSFVHGTDGVVLDSTYPIYKFEFINIHPATDGTTLGFQANAAGGSGYNETMTTTSFRAFHNEADNDAALGYVTGNDQANGTAFQSLTDNIGNVSDESASGTLHIFNPSSTTFVKHFISTSNTYQNSNYSMNTFVAGYFNTTSAIDEIQFKINSGNIDSGKIKLYGIKDS